MILHQVPEFKDAVEVTASFFNLRPIFVEKDYWVTFVLRNLSLSDFHKNVVFKGGTSLSKAYNCIDRFSEDIDLAILKESFGEGAINDNQIKTKIKQVEDKVTVGLNYVKHTNEEKRGRNRRTFYAYPKVLKEQDFGNVKDLIQLEINSFTNPVPYNTLNLSPYIEQFMAKNGYQESIEAYNLHPFPIQVLTRERTFFEKLLSLIRLSYEGPDKLREKVRHFYDLHKLIEQGDLQELLLTENSYHIIKLALDDDASNKIFSGDWMEKPFTDSPLLKDIGITIKDIKTRYESELSQLIWTNNLPPILEIEQMLLKIKSFLKRSESQKLS